MTESRILLLGFGEVGQTLLAGLRAQGQYNIFACDRLFADPLSAPSQAAARASIQAGLNAAEAARSTSLVISAVTADQCQAAAEAAANGLADGCFFLDLNSVAPDTRHAACAHVARAGGRYVEAAVMAPIAPRGIATPMLLGGPHAADFAPLAAALGFAATPIATEIGTASAIKLCRSILVKGMEALVIEAFTTARAHGVEAQLLDSLGDFFPDQDWRRRAGYFLSRALEHGLRRAAEMDEAARMADHAGIVPVMSIAAAVRQETAGAAGLPAGETLEELLDHLRAHDPAALAALAATRDAA